jgi:hypothetical protein
MQMIRFGFNLLLFVVLLILFIGYCWAIKIDRDYNAKIEGFNNKKAGLENIQDPFMSGSYNNPYLYGANVSFRSNALTPKNPAPIDFNSPGLSTPEKDLLDAYLLRQKNKNTQCNNNDDDDDDDNDDENNKNNKNKNNKNTNDSVLGPSQIPSVANMGNDPWKTNSLNIPSYPDNGDMLQPYISAKNTPPLLMSNNDSNANKVNNNLYNVNICNDSNLPIK